MKPVPALIIPLLCIVYLLVRQSPARAADRQKIAAVSGIDRTKGEIIARYASAETPMKI